MSNNQDPHASLANLLYTNGTAERPTDEPVDTGLMQYLDHFGPEPSDDEDDAPPMTEETARAFGLPPPRNATASDNKAVSGTASPAPPAVGGKNEGGQSSHQAPAYQQYHLTSQPDNLRQNNNNNNNGGASGGVTSAQNQNHEQTQNQDQNERRSITPSNNNNGDIPPIPSSLARLASQTISSLSLPDPNILNGQEVIEQAALLADYGDRGEMGGKRRKLPHERAGWKEMDEQQQSQNLQHQNGGPTSSNKRRRVKKNDVSPSNANTEVQQDTQLNQAASQPTATMTSDNLPTQSNVRNDNSTSNTRDSNQDKYENDIRHLTELSNSIMKQDINKTISSLSIPSEQSQSKDVSEQLDPALSATSSNQKATNESESAEQGADSKLSRAEQNKRAQQAFRRRREEHMKKLEMDSAQLSLVKRQMDQKDVYLRDLVMELESSKIEIAALRASLQFVIPHSTIFPLTEQGTLNLGEEVTVNSDTPVTEDEVLNAFELLEKQSREVAKQNRARRE
ncbi:uncharacterized protein L201_004487 [Kwoniella dendrophila CBS 6074]|uniref:BZIP domain-containing protein n=1 Tax=Kwoniella dendrophila CBS 6074 TaxID=1295534 RepID=A0AAX4JYG6_9TREE